ncbi:MAG: HIRAN domain-containing protein [Paramuribaculum sp.]|nr:HIRAN domain-containing protein [Paramuribaculum sp.]
MAQEQINRKTGELEQSNNVAVIGISRHRLITEGTGPWEPEYQYSEFFFKECAVAGLSYHLENDDELWNELELGTKLALVRDRNNKYDRNAVAVALAGDYGGDPDDFDFDFILGYIPKNENAELAAMLDAGYAGRFSAKITTLNKYGNYNERIRITIFVRSLEKEFVRPDLLRAQSVSLLELREMVKELNEKGIAYFSWGGYQLMEWQRLDEGEKVVIVYRDEDSEILYLLRVLAVGEDCLRYVKDPDLIHSCDDCIPYVLTNIMGPVSINKSDWHFLTGVDLDVFSATDYLSSNLSAGFKGIFKRQLLETLNRDNMDMNPSIDE